MNAALLSSSASAFTGVAIRPRSITRARAARAITVAAADRPLWCPGVAPPKHLDGSLAADFGFDPLGLGKDPTALKWYVQAELVHSRFAMTAVAGILIPGLLKSAGILRIPEWYTAGQAANGYFAPFSVLLAIQIILFGFVETKRWVDFNKPGSQGEPGSFLGLEGGLKGKENGYPGGIFDPLGFSNSATYEENKVKELKNGRLAMLAFIGFCAQYLATGKGPLENLATHLSNPALNNFTTNGVSLPFKI